MFANASSNDASVMRGVDIVAITSPQQFPTGTADDPWGEANTHVNSSSSLLDVTLLLAPSAAGVYRYWLVGSVLTAFAVFTVAGNALVMVAVAREPYLRTTVTNYFIVSLAVADLIIGTVVMPFSIALEATDGWWPFGPDWCDVWHSFDVLASTASILNLSMIALDRYWAITDPIAYPSRMSTGRAFVLIGIVWICSAAISFPAIVWWRNSAADQSSVDGVALGGIQPQSSCTFTEDSAYLIVSSLVSFYCPVSIILFAYYRIYAAATAQMRSLERGSKVMTAADCGNRSSNGEAMTLRIHRGGGGVVTAGNRNSGGVNASTNGSTWYRCSEAELCSSDNNTTDGGSPSRRNVARATTTCGQQQQRPRTFMDADGANNSSRVVSRRWKTLTVSRRRLSRVARERKAAKTLGIVMGVFCACWVPFFITNLLYGACRHVGCVHDPDTLFRVFTWLGYINSGMNPVIYACSLRDFRRAFARITGCCCCYCDWICCWCCADAVSTAAARRNYRPGSRATVVLRRRLQFASPADDDDRASTATRGRYSSSGSMFMMTSVGGMRMEDSEALSTNVA